MKGTVYSFMLKLILHVHTHTMGETRVPLENHWWIALQTDATEISIKWNSNPSNSFLTVLPQYAGSSDKTIVTIVLENSDAGAPFAVPYRMIASYQGEGALHPRPGN